jgi:hypothetical protein
MPRYVKLTKGTQANPSQAVSDEVVVADPGNVLMAGAKPVIANLTAAPTQADFNNLLAALRTRGVIG